MRGIHVGGAEHDAKRGGLLEREVEVRVRKAEEPLIGRLARARRELHRSGQLREAAPTHLLEQPVLVLEVPVTGGRQGQRKHIWCPRAREGFRRKRNHEARSKA